MVPDRCGAGAVLAFCRTALVVTIVIILALVIIVIMALMILCTGLEPGASRSPRRRVVDAA